MKDLKERTLRGGFAKACAQATTVVLRIGSVMILARLLDPTDFGMVGMVTVVAGVFAVFKDAGLSLVTVQRAAITDEQLSALFWVNVVVGIVLALLLLASAPILVAFYREPRLFWVTAAMASSFVVNAAGVQHTALLQREMRFVALATIDVLSWLVSIGVGIGMAMGGFGYWALVWMAVSLPAAATAGAWLATAWIPGTPRRGVGLGSMIGFGSTVTLNVLVIYVAYNADKLLVGRLWGAEALGIYGRAYQLISIPTDNLNGAVGGVAVSALSRLQSDAGRLKSYFLKSYSLVLGLTVPVTAACALFAEDIVLVLLGQKWRDAAPIFRLMAPTILVFAMLNPLAWLLFASGRVGRSLKMALVIAPVVIAGYVAGLPYGPNGIAFGYSAAMVLLTVPMIAWAIRGTDVTLADLLRAIIPPFVSATLATALAFTTVLSMGAALGPFTRLLLGGSVLLASYVLMLLFVMGRKASYLDLIRDSSRAVRGRRNSRVEAVLVSHREQLSDSNLH